MPKIIRETTRLIKQRLQKTGASGIPLDFRLFLFLAVLVLTVVLGVIAILLITGTFTAGMSESEHLVKNELQHASQGISQQYGELSLQAIVYADRLSRSIEEHANKLGIPVADLANHPEVLDEVISGEYERALFALQRSKSSGVFFILDATVNPALADAENSRAGLYLKNMEPNIISSSSPNIILLRGFPGISRQNSLSLHTQWDMEFDVSQAPYYHRPIQAAKSSRNLPLSRLYYWSPVCTLPGTSEEVMICSVPLIDSRGNVFGVGGLEISTMLFKLSHLPNNSVYNRLFCVLSPLTENTMDINRSMFAGGYSARIIAQGDSNLKILPAQRSFHAYEDEGGNSYLGMHTSLPLYPRDSAFAEETWSAAVMVPRADIMQPIGRLNLLLISLLLILVLLGIAASFIISRRFLQPLAEGFDIIKSTDLSTAPRTRIPEIDDLIAFLALHNEELYEKARQENLSISILDEFVENTQQLSLAERSVFDLYVKGHNAKEIAEILCLSINTIKTHSKRIYMKLNVATREELLLYANLLKEIGKEIP